MLATGRVRALRDGFVYVELPRVALGDGIRIERDDHAILAQIISVDGASAIAAPFQSPVGIRCGDRVVADPRPGHVIVGTQLFGRVLNGLGESLDGGQPAMGYQAALVTPIPATQARVVGTQVCWTGVRAIDGLLTLARGARTGIFGAPGAGKSTLLQMLVRGVQADAVVVAAVGERGREATAWAQSIDHRTTLFVETSDASASLRLRAAFYAVAQAAALRARGLNVLLVLDSLARVGAAQREIGIAAGEPVGRGGYPASVVPTLARLLEVAGSLAHGSITLVATVLSDGDDRDPLSEAARSLLDGHITLSSELAQRGYFPAIDLLASSSRTMDGVVTNEHARNAVSMRAAMALIARYADARALGLVTADAAGQRAEAAQVAIEEFLCQRQPGANPDRTLAELAALADTLE